MFDIYLIPSAVKQSQLLFSNIFEKVNANIQPFVDSAYD